MDSITLDDEIRTRCNYYVTIYFYYIDFLKKNSFELDFAGLVKSYSDSLFYSGFLTDMEISIDSMKELLAKIKDKNDLIAEKFIEKINDNSVI